MTLEELEERCRKLPDQTLFTMMGDNGQVALMMLTIPGGLTKELVEPGQSITEAVERLLTLAETGKEQA